MTDADRLRAALTTLRWSQRLLAGILGKDERQVRRWATGVYSPPSNVLAWLELLAEFHHTHPSPCEPSRIVP